MRLSKQRSTFYSLWGSGPTGTPKTKKEKPKFLTLFFEKFKYSAFYRPKLKIFWISALFSKKFIRFYLTFCEIYVTKKFQPHKINHGYTLYCLFAVGSIICERVITKLKILKFICLIQTSKQPMNHLYHCVSLDWLKWNKNCVRQYYRIGNVNISPKYILWWEKNGEDSFFAVDKISKIVI